MPDSTEIRPAVFIIESPSARDILDERSEGEALCAGLRLAGIHALRYRVYDRDALDEAFRRLALETRTRTHFVPGQQVRTTLVVPSFHFSAHGNAEGIALTSGEFLTWEELRSTLLQFARASGTLSDRDDVPFAAIEVVFSACEGLSARKMFGFGKPFPCVVVVGPTVPVTWPEALTAFLTFYHLTIAKRMKPDDAVFVMNASAGLENVFQFCRYVDWRDADATP